MRRRSWPGGPRPKKASDVGPLAQSHGMEGCACDECARKASLLPALRLAGVPLALELERDLERHKRRRALGLTASGDVVRGQGNRPWLAYDPDAFLPRPYDGFLLSGHCPQVRWPLEDEKEVRACYLVGCGRSGSTIFAEILSHYRRSLKKKSPRRSRGLLVGLFPLDRPVRCSSSTSRGSCGCPTPPWTCGPRQLAAGYVSRCRRSSRRSCRRPTAGRGGGETP